MRSHGKVTILNPKYELCSSLGITLTLILSTNAQIERKQFLVSSMLRSSKKKWSPQEEREPLGRRESQCSRKTQLILSGSQRDTPTRARRNRLKRILQCISLQTDRGRKGAFLPSEPSYDRAVVSFPLQVSRDNNLFLVVALDGQPVKPGDLLEVDHPYFGHVDLEFGGWSGDPHDLPEFVTVLDGTLLHMGIPFGTSASWIR
jgi:hypothetical protein